MSSRIGGRSHLAVSIPVIVIILGLYAMTVRNLVIAGGNVFAG